MGILITAPQDRAYEQGLTVGVIRGKAEGKAEGLVEGIAEGLAEGIAEERERWMDYDRRMQEWSRKFKESQQNGEPFDEPQPKPPDL